MSFHGPTWNEDIVGHYFGTLTYANLGDDSHDGEDLRKRAMYARTMESQTYSLKEGSGCFETVVDAWK